MDKKVELSEYQKAIINYVRNNTGNILVDAKAGSGKTFTLIMVADELTQAGNKCLFLAFNKHIVEELQTKITNPECMIKTVHSLGYSFIASYLCRIYGFNNFELIVNQSKLRDLVKEYYDKYFRPKLDLYNSTGVYTKEDFERLKSSQDVAENGAMLDDKSLKELHNNLISDFVGLCNFSRLYNINYKSEGSLVKLVKKFCWYLDNYIDDVLSDYQDLVIAVIDRTKELFENPVIGPDGRPIVEIDYTDMIYFPVYYNMGIPAKIRPYLDTILVDEAQDLSILQQKFIQMLSTNFNRFIFVGDKFQSIYGFSGADTSAIEKLNDTFILNHLPLNICYRCPKNIVKIAKQIVPTIEWNESRPDVGEVNFISMKEAVKLMKPDDVLIGRRNKDLIKIYRMFVLTLKKSVKFRNSGLVDALVKNVEQVIVEYMKLYSKGVNIQKPLSDHMKEYIVATGCISGTEPYEIEYKEYSKKLVDENSGKSSRVLRPNPSISYLKKSMEEYKNLGAYGDAEDPLTEFYDVVSDFIEEFSNSSSKILVDDLKKYIRTFLSGSMYDKVPVISSVHSMKGGEADNIFIYDYPKFPYVRNHMSEDDEQQEKNLQYVAVTRAKKKLYLIECDTSDEGNIALNANCEAAINHIIKPF